MDGQDTKCRRKIAENYNRMSRVHERYRRQTDRRQTDGRQHIANVNVVNMSRLHYTELEQLFLFSDHQNNAECRRPKLNSFRASRISGGSQRLLAVATVSEYRRTAWPLEQSSCRRPVCPVTHNISSETENSFISTIVS